MQPVDLHDELTYFALQPGFLDLLPLAFGFHTLAVIEDPGGAFKHLGFPLRDLHRVKIIFGDYFLYRFEPFEGLQRDPRLEL